MSHAVICVVNCENTGKNSNLEFYKFPLARLDQKEDGIVLYRK